MSTDLAAQFSRETKISEIRAPYRAVRARIAAERDACWDEAVKASCRRVWALMDGLDVTPGPVARIHTVLSTPEVTRRKAIAALLAEMEKAAAHLARIQEAAESAWDEARVERARRTAPFNFLYEEPAA